MTISNDFQTISWQSPSNIALIKYWGKHGIQLPNNASLSMTLKSAVTNTQMQYRNSKNGLKIEYYFEGKRNLTFEQKVVRFLESIIHEFPFLKLYELVFESSNSFPHSTGIASSASSMCALALCLVTLEELATEKKYSKVNFFQRASHIARLGSGSASRSVYGAWATWGETDLIESSSNLYATPLQLSIHEKFMKMGDAVLLVSSKQKAVSSTLGHGLMNKHPYAKGRYVQAGENLKTLMKAMERGDFETFASVVENEALSLHGLLMTSSPDGMLIKPESIAIIEAVRKFRKEKGVEVCFTLDAGPNVHLLYPLNEKAKIHAFIKSELVQFCEYKKWLDDETGEGPDKIK